ncbi:glutaredoxin [Epithele typhae]|uniref:glutaredoxin n=1 Tax=Epithele typhae TaxID=378194 RepID=UPI0020082AF8|nr:glutaredoxin [Epithele typhae]KAH9929601.1 glutaredoxin [Epithele typhae]
MAPPPSARPWAGSPYRRRRLLWTVALLTIGSVFCLTQYGPPAFSLSESFKDMSFSSGSSRAGLVGQAKAAMYAGEGALKDLQEMDALLHFLTAYPERTFNEDGQTFRVEGMGSVEVDPSKPVDLRIYAPDGRYDWDEYMKQVQKNPLVVFSKTYCPYSKKAKKLLNSYDLTPPPLVFELDKRSDGPQVQAILKRLTKHATVPNIVLNGKSIGGSDHLEGMHAQGLLKTLLGGNGLKINGNV